MRLLYFVGVYIPSSCSSFLVNLSVQHPSARSSIFHWLAPPRRPIPISSFRVRCGYSYLKFLCISHCPHAHSTQDEAGSSMLERKKEVDCSSLEFGRDGGQQRQSPILPTILLIVVRPLLGEQRTGGWRLGFFDSFPFWSFGRTRRARHAPICTPRHPHGHTPIPCSSTAAPVFPSRFPCFPPCRCQPAPPWLPTAGDRNR